MGTDAWRNWRAYGAQAAEVEYVEDEAHADRQFTGGPARLGPTTLHVVLREAEVVGPAVIMHMGIHAHLMPELIIDGDFAPADSSAYHGGTMSDEIAALIALELGVRLRVAGTRLLSGVHGSSPETPIHLEVPPLGRTGKPGRDLLPRLAQRSTNLDTLKRLNRFSELDAATAVELVRAAREYASAIWWADEDPDQGWLHLVSATEIAAAHRQKESAPAEELVREHWPELWKALDGADVATRSRVAKQVARQMRATRRFTNFIAELAPEPPQPRPEWDELDWSKVRECAQVIYGHRSKALHAGKPFPLPLRKSPRSGQDGSLQEVPAGITSGGAGAIWEHWETPMLLSTFEYIVRGALLNWWDELLETVPEGTSEGPG